MTRSILLSALVAGAALAAATPASAVVISFTGGNSSTDGTDGNVRVFSASGINLQATAWSYNSSNTLVKSYLGRYSSGLGVTNPSEGNGNSNNSHTIDNVSQKDFVLLVFDKAVNISSAVLTPYDVASGPNDNDATVSYATASLFASPAPSTTAISTANPVFATLLANDWVVSGNTSPNYSTALNSAGKFGNVWLIGASFANPDRNSDGFKLSSITFTAAPPPGVPEPATWAMLISGFGLAGVAMRRRQSVAFAA